jgi:hypothetical protein
MLFKDSSAVISPVEKGLFFCGQSINQVGGRQCQSRQQNITNTPHDANEEDAKHHEANKHETPAHHAHLARGHHEHAMHRAAEAAKSHIEHHGRAGTAQAAWGA